MRHYILFSLFLSVLVCCSRPQKKATKSSIITLALQVKPEVRAFSDFFKIKKLIPLETSDHSLIGDISNICIANHKIYIADDATQAILVFDTNGKFLSKLANKGKGEGEYIKVGCFQVNADGTIIVYDSQTGRLISYSAGGELFSELKLPFYVDEFVQVDRSTRIVYSDNSIENNTTGEQGAFNAVILKNDSEIASACKNDSRLKTHSYKDLYFRAFNYSGKDIYLTETFGDTIYAVTKNNILPKYKIDFPDKLPACENIDTDYFKKYNRSINNIFENDTTFFFEYQSAGWSNALLYHKQNNTYTYLRTFRDEANGFYLKIFPAKGQHNHLIAIVDPSRLHESYSDRKKDEVPETLKYLRDNVKITDNPVLVLYEAK